MKRPFSLLLAASAALLASTGGAAAGDGAVAHDAATAPAALKTDWLLDPAPFTGSVRESTAGAAAGTAAGTVKTLVIGNGLAERVIQLAPNAATIALRELRSGENHVRAVRPEALLTLDSEQVAVGGLTGQPIQNYLLPEFLPRLKSDPNAFQFSRWTTREIQPRLEWKPRPEWLPKNAAGEPLAAAWPPKGTEVQLHFTAPPNNAKLRGVSVTVHYEIYDGIPLFCKWLTIANNTGREISLDRFTSEILAMPEQPWPDGEEARRVCPKIHVETDYSFCSNGYNGPVRWKTDPSYKTSISWSHVFRCLLEVTPPIGPKQKIVAGTSFQTFRAWELIYDSTERERRGLSLRKMYRALAPWSQENPIMQHVRNADDKSVRNAIDQCAETGFELVILTFGSGFAVDAAKPHDVERVKRLADYAHSKGIALGGYSLFSSRKINADVDVVNPKTGKTGGFAIFGNAPCLASDWGLKYLEKLRSVLNGANMDMLELDGPYPGDYCASKKHAAHASLDDSQWTQWKLQTDLFAWSRKNGLFVNAPDWYYLNGANKNALGYRETNWSLPRAQQEIIERQNIFDGTWDKTPSMGWMFVPLTVYHGGGKAATIEPLDEHLEHYNMRLANLFGAGVQACWRGPRLYDTPRVRDTVKKWVAFYKKHRAILDSDIIHLRRPDGQDWDGILHVNPALKERALLFVSNPLTHDIEREIRVPLYYAGATGSATFREQDAGAPLTLPLARDNSALLKVKIPARSQTWFVVE